MRDSASHFGIYYQAIIRIENTANGNMYMHLFSNSILETGISSAENQCASGGSKSLILIRLPNEQLMY